MRGPLRDASPATSAQRCATSGDGSHLAGVGSGSNAPTMLHNIGNTCFMNALLQCCRQVLSRLPSHLLPKSQRCPLAVPLRQQTFTEEEISQWACWNYLPVGPQRDACHILETCFDDAGPMHSSCTAADCYGALFRSLTSLELVRVCLCESSPLHPGIAAAVHLASGARFKHREIHLEFFERGPCPRLQLRILSWTESATADSSRRSA